jgi:hypothetical protein
MTVQNLAQGFQSYRDWATDPVPRIGFGMDWFDRPTGGGLARSEIAMMMAFSSVGKTTVALNIIRNNPHIPTLFFSLEMNWRMVAARLAAMELPSTTKDLESRLRHGDAIPELVRVQDKYRGFVCDDMPAISLKQASESFEDATRELGTAPRLVIFDYLELISGGGLMSKSEQVDKASQKARDWARIHDCSVILLHQVGKGEGGHEPLDLGSGRYGGFAPMDYVCGAYAPRLEKGITQQRYEQVKEEIWFQLLKSRSGAANPVGSKYRLDASTMRISPWHDQVQIPNFYQAQQASIADLLADPELDGVSYSDEEPTW